MDIVYVTADDLKPYGNNPRRNDDAVDAVAESIIEFGFKVPIVVSSDMTIVTGHTRLKAARKLGMKEVPCIIADDLTDEQIDAFRLADGFTRKEIPGLYRNTLQMRGRNRQHAERRRREGAREITSSTYENAQRRSQRSLNSWFGRGM